MTTSPGWAFARPSSPSTSDRPAGRHRPPAPLDAWPRRLVLLLLAAVLLRLVPVFTWALGYDDAVEGLMSQDILRGRFPLFFYGQAVHGAADRYLAAVVFWLIGASPVALRLGALVLFGVFLWSFAYTTQRIFGAPVATVATLLVAVPPYYLFGWSLDTRGHYVLMLTFGTWLLFLTWKLRQTGLAASPARWFVGLGFLGGVAWWTNYLSLTFLAPIAGALAVQAAREVRGAWRPLAARGAIVLAGFLTGLAPLLGYYLANRVPLIPPGSPVERHEVAGYLDSLTARALPQILGVHAGVWKEAFPWAYGAVAALIAGALLLAAGAWLVARARRRPVRDTTGLLLGVVVVTLLLSLLTRYGAILRYPRYLLPLYLAIPVFLGLWLHRLRTVSPTLAWLLVGGLVANNLAGSLTMTPLLASEAATAREQEWPAAMAAHLDFLAGHGLRHVYGGSNLWPLLSGRRVWASDPYRERMIEVAREVDAAERIGWVFRAPSPAFEGTAAAAGIRYRRLEGPGFVVYTDFERPATGYAAIEPAGWSATASEAPEAAAFAYDRDVRTAWRGHPRAPAGAFYQLDLGRPYPLGRLSWLPARWTETPAGLVVAVSLDGVAWRPIVEVPEHFGLLYWSGTHPFQRVRRGRVELRLPTTEARFVRIQAAPSASAWSIRELLVERPAGECPRRPDPAALVRLLVERGVQAAYGDHWISANIAKLSGESIHVLHSNLAVDSYRLTRPHPDEIEVLRVRGGRAIVVEACPVETADAVAALLRDSGVAFARREAGGFVVFGDLRQVAYGGTPATSRGGGAGAGTLEATLEAPRRVGYVTVACDAPMPSAVSASELALETSADGRAFAPTAFRLVQQGKLRLSGSRLFRDAPTVVVFQIVPRDLAAVRITRSAAGPAWCPVERIVVGP